MTTPKKLKIIGMNTENNTLNCSQQNKDVFPTHFEWDTTPGYEAETIVLFDHSMPEYPSCKCKILIGILFESMELRPWHYEFALQHKDKFDLILTHNVNFIKLGHPFAFFPAGGSFLREWGLFQEQKTKECSLIVGKKNQMSGHIMRHTVAEAVQNFNVDVFGLNDWFESKVEALRPYLYSIVIENTQQDYWFTEKIIDALSQATVPIYWGCPSIGKFFDMQGILTFDTVEQLKAILAYIGENDYHSRLDAIKHNLSLANRYSVCEDWLSHYYPEYF